MLGNGQFQALALPLDRDKLSWQPVVVNATRNRAVAFAAIMGLNRPMRRFPWLAGGPLVRGAGVTIAAWALHLYSADRNAESPWQEQGVRLALTQAGPKGH